MMSLRWKDPRLAALCLTLWAGQAHAHVSEQAFVLLLPTDLFIMAGCGAVALSMVLMAFVPPRAIHGLFRPLELARWPTVMRLRRVTRWVGLAVVLGLVLIGMIGPRDPLGNLLPLSVWTVWWMALIVVVALAGNVLGWFYPFAAPPPDVPDLRNAAARGPGHWPALTLFMVFGVFSIVDPAPDDPDRLAMVVLGYVMLTVVGGLLTSPRRWAEHAEPFGILFRLVGALAPLTVEGGRLRLGFPGWALVRDVTPPVGFALWALVFLGVGSFDGFKETFWWLGLLGINPLEFPGRSAVVVPNAIGLLGFVGALIGIFALAIRLGLRLAGGGMTFRQGFAGFALSLLPIAVGYHAAHFLISVLIDSQYVPLALSDPMARGADLFGWADGTVTTGFLNTRDSVRMLFLTQTIVVVWSHVLAVLIAHHVASRHYATRRQVLLVQLPLALFMIAYTLFGLWLLAAPRGV